MFAWDEYPINYRASEVAMILNAARSGESVAVVGLSGSGKSNLLGYIANRKLRDSPPDENQSVGFYLVDCNRITEPSSEKFFSLLLNVTQQNIFLTNNKDVMGELEMVLGNLIASGKSICLLIDRFDAISMLPVFQNVAGILRSLRDLYKYRLSYVIGLRRLFDPHNELSELFFGRTLWLGPLNRQDAIWSARRDLHRMTKSLSQDAVVEKLVDLSWGYPSLLRAACEAFAQGASIESAELCAHPSVQRRINEFWADEPTLDELRLSKVLNHPWLQRSFEEKEPILSQSDKINTTLLTAKENLLLEYLQRHPGVVCDKDELIKAVWSDEVIFEQGVRDESLAQLVRRVRLKIELNPGEPRFIQTIPGRGYLFKP